ncbi:hypothetical protein PZA11_002503 [Diplocarpon coronariae]|uniref:Uncharacterized protein n=1 Tax=Diplocarpon coronariae TaxID=2795749 RepID=A0A218ZAI0_9HELO|nr:hypothetical protein B2J93_578 [Marssonina coronariae]
MSYYFGLTAAQTAAPALCSLGSVEKALLSALVHTFRLGVLLAERKLAAPGAENEAAGPAIDMAAPGAEECRMYIESAMKSDAAADKLFPLRLTGPAMRFITARLPVGLAPLSPMAVFQLCIWRTFAFGNIAHMELLELDLGEGPPVFDLIESVVTAWGGPERIGVPAYGQLQILKKNVGEMLGLLWGFSQHLSNTFAIPGAPFTFGKLIAMLTGWGGSPIHAIPQHGLISWVLTGDFAEYGLCEPATADDLAEHIINTHAHGARSALSIVARRAGVAAPAPSDDVGAELSLIFSRVLHVLQCPPTDAIREVAGDCQRLQGRAITAVDLEHAFCKIARMESRARRGGARPGARAGGKVGGKGKLKKGTKDEGEATEASTRNEPGDEGSESAGTGSSGSKKRKRRQ